MVTSTDSGLLTVDLACESLGSAGPPVVVLHGLFGAGRNWHTVGRRLAATRRVLLVDLRNHGRSPRARPMDYPAMAADVAASIVRWGRGPAAMIGHSMGGKVAMWLALTEPEHVAQLAVIDIAPVVYAHDHLEHVDALAGVPLAGLRGRREADLALADQIRDPSMRAFLLQNLVNVDGQWTWRVDLDAVRDAMLELTSFPSPPAAARYTGPSLLVRGARSDYVTPAGISAFAALFPNHGVSTIDRAGHWPHAERPDAVAGLLEDFVRGAGVEVRG
ncbi:MAG: alpha/beta fold hydrolase [Pseudomonadota bacterium]